MKKIRMLSLLLALALCLSLAACAGEKTPAADPTDDPGVTEPSRDPVQPEDTDPSAEPTDAQTPEDPAGPADGVDYVQVITDARGEGETTPIMTATTEDDPTEKEMTFALLGFTPEDVEDYGVSLSLMNVRAYAIVAVKPAQGKEDMVQEGLENFVEGQKGNFEHYLEDQYEIASNAKLEKLSDGTILLVMCENQDAVFGAMKTALEG